MRKIESVRILKVGGASLLSARSVRKETQRILEGGYQVVVVSAFSNITNILEATAEFFFLENPTDALDFFESKFVNYHKKIAKSLGIERALCEYVQNLKQELQESTDVDTWSSEPESKKKFLQYILTFGERISAEIFYRYLQKQSTQRICRKDARSLIFTDPKAPDEDGGFAPNVQLSLQQLSSGLKDDMYTNQIVVLEGFIAAGNTNLGRNGSDTTLALVARACHCLGLNPEVFYLKAGPFETDEEGNLSYHLFLAEQEVFPQPFVHPDAVRLLAQEHIPFHVLSSKDPNYQLSVGEPQTTSENSNTFVLEKEAV